MAIHFPKKVYGACPFGHNPKPRGTSDSQSSTTEISTGEGRELVWSNYRQDHICKMSKREVDDAKYQTKFHAKDVHFQKKLDCMGFTK